MPEIKKGERWYVDIKCFRGLSAVEVVDVTERTVKVQNLEIDCIDTIRYEHPGSEIEFIEKIVEN